jgi:SAM-dependent methyltransferase
MAQSVERFSSRVKNYARYRPGYPAAIINLLTSECGLSSNSVVADVGSGTGKLSEIFLENGNVVFGVEPNAEMRAAAEQILHGYSTFRSIEGTAESTTMAPASIDFVTAGQAFHWFEPEKARAESIRILKPEGWAVLIWNERLTDTTDFLRDYEGFLLDYGTDYQEVRHENASEAIAKFFAPVVHELKSFPNSQEFDYEGLKGRVLSSSYTPEPEDSRFEPMLQSLQEIFAKHESFGRVSFDYVTKLYYGQLANNPDPDRKPT